MNRIFVVALLSSLQISVSALQAEDILSNLGGFEQPGVTARTRTEKGGDPSLSGEHGLFASFTHRVGNKDGTITAGLTNEIARSGTQSIYIDVDKLSSRYEGAAIQSNPIPILPSHTYKTSIWGKMDSKKPFVIQNRPLYLKLQIDFFSADKLTQTGETVYLIQPIPGTKNREAFFDDKKWTEFGTEFSTPEDALFIVVTWHWDTGSEPGETSGLIYFDDFTVRGDMPAQSMLQLIQAEKEPEKEPEADSDEMAPAKSGTAAAAGAVTTGSKK